MESRLYCILTVALIFIHAANALTPMTSPEAIVQSQLLALQKDDMLGVYEFASPRNKQQTGTVERFGQMVRSGPYKYLVGHKKADILLASNMAASKQYLVRVISDDTETNKQKIVEFWWSLSICKAGPNMGCYMVDAVIPNA